MNNIYLARTFHFISVCIAHDSKTCSQYFSSKHSDPIGISSLYIFTLDQFQDSNSALPHVVFLYMPFFEDMVIFSSDPNRSLQQPSRFKTIYG